VGTDQSWVIRTELTKGDKVGHAKGLRGGTTKFKNGKHRREQVLKGGDQRTCNETLGSGETQETLSLPEKGD